MPGKKKDNNAAMLKLTPGQMKMIKSMMEKNEGSESATKKGRMKNMSGVKKRKNMSGINKGSRYKGSKKK
tara:strand:+ start:4607 stop:4816 length:210 start_codon:yes stop_codon:yes gene_type:complete